MIWYWILTALAILWTWGMLGRIHNTLKEIKMDQAALAQALTAAVTQLNKALDEIIRAIQNAGNTTPEVDAALANLQAAAQALDDLNPDTPAPTP